MSTYRKVILALAALLAVGSAGSVAAQPRDGERRGGEPNERVQRGPRERGGGNREQGGDRGGGRGQDRQAQVLE